MDYINEDQFHFADYVINVHRGMNPNILDILRRKKCIIDEFFGPNAITREAGDSWSYVKTTKQP